MRPQLLAWLAIGAVALYVIATVLGRSQAGRCVDIGGQMECTLPKDAPRNPPKVAPGETLA